MPTADFTLTRAKQGADQVHAIVTITVDGTRYPFAATAIADPSSYTDGFKAARLLHVEDLVFGLSDRRGPMQATRAKFQLSDIPDPVTGRTVFRQWLHERKRLRGAEVEIRIITDAQRRLAYTPKTIFRGLVQEVSGLAGFVAEFECIGLLGPALGKFAVTDTLGNHFTGLPADLQDLPIPIALGRLTDAGSSTAAPTLEDEVARGVVGEISGYGDLPGTPATSPSITEDVGMGTVAPGTYRAQIFAFHSGAMANPAPFLAADLEITIAASTSAITVSWTAASGGADFYRVAIGPIHTFGTETNVYWHQYLQTTGTSVQFTNEWAWNGDADLTPGAVALGAAAGIFYEAWSAVMADGETPLSEERISIELPFGERPRRTVVAPVGSALSYYVYRRAAGYRWAKRLAVPTSAVNGDGNIYADYTEASAWQTATPPTPKGRIRPILIGPLTDVEGFSWPVVGIYAAHTCDISTPVDVFLVENEGQADEVITPIDPARYGVDVAAPGQTGFASFWGADYYTDGSGHRWMFVTYRGSDAEDIIDGTKSLRINALGMDDVGDATGSVIEDIPDQIAVLFDNSRPFAAASAIGGALNGAPPTFADSTPKRDTASFALAAANAAAIMPEGLAGSRWLTERITWGALFAEMFRSAGLLGGINAEGQIQIVFTNPFQTPVAGVSFVDEILANSFLFSDRQDGYATRIPYEYRPEYSAPGGTPFLAEHAEVISTDVEAEVEREDDDVLTLPWRSNAVQAKATAELALQAARDLPRVVPMASGIHWTMLKLGDLVPVTHPQGPVENGYQGQVVQVLGYSVDVANLRVELTCLEPRVTGTDGAGNAFNDRMSRAWLAEGALSVWPLTETSGTVAADIGPNNDDGAYSGAPALGAAMPYGGRALVLDGSTDGLDLSGSPLSAMGTTRWYFGLRVTPDSTGGDGHGALFLENSSPAIGLAYKKAVKKLSFLFGGVDHLSTTELVDGVEVAIVVVYENGVGTIFLNDIADGTFAACPDWTPNIVSMPWGRVKGRVRDLAYGPGLLLTAAQRSRIYSAR